MYLKRLEVKGFKSFADKIDLDFVGGITAIVGPNGSGKSNISDAIRWVLGEQSAKTLRGAKMEDVIFVGTENRKSLGCSEVTLTIDNGSKILPIDYSEVTVTRRLYRSGESEYLLNNTTCRLKDIVELFMDTGIGKDGYSLIGQGKIDEILSSRSEDRRNIFEEAAGIVKYKTRKQEAERRLENTKQNLVRISDIIEELREQIEPLQEQSIVAKKYLTLRDELKELEVNVILHNYNNAMGKLDSMTKNIEELTGSGKEYEAKKTELINLIQILREKITEVDLRLEESNNRRFDSEKSLESKQGNLKLLNERYDNLTREQNRIEEEIREYNQAISNLEVKKNNYDENKNELREKVIAQNSIINGIIEEYSDFNRKCLDFENVIENSKADLIQILKDISNINNKINSSEVINQNLINRRMQLEKELSIKNDGISGLIKDIDNSFGIVKNFEDRIESAKGRLKENLLNIKLLSEDEGKLKNKRNKSFDVLKTKEARYKTLQDMERDMEGFNKAVKGIIANYRDNKSVFGTVSDIIEVPRGYETAIEIALGFSVQNIIVDNENTTSNLIGYLKKHHLGRATFLPLTTIKNRDVSIDRNKLKIDGFLGTASEIIRYDERFNNAISNLLGRVFICKTLENAKELAKRTDYNYRIVTIEGDVINSGGSFTGGSSNIKGSGLFSRKNEIKELEDSIEESGRELKEIEIKILNNNRELDDSKKLNEALNSEIQSISYDIKGEQGKLNTLKIQRQETENTIRDIQIELEQIFLEYDRSTALINENKNLLLEFTNGQNSIEEKINSMQLEFKSYQAGREEISERITKEKIDLTEKQKSLEMFEGKIEEIIRETRGLKNKIQLCSRGLEENEIKLEETKLSIKNILIDIQRSAEGIVAIKDKISELEISKKECQSKLIAKEKEQLNIDESLRDIINSIHRIEVQKSKIESEVEVQCNKLWEEYELSIAQADRFRREIPNLSEANKRLNELRTNIKLLGNVNINAIEEFKRVTERYEFLIVQREDLLKGEQSLLDIIEEITKKMKVQFEENFALIRENFNITFRELFGGGHADLKLENDDILNSGIDIIVQPPGKKLQSLSLLSGGERGLAAIALLFAILKMKPTPFCVLDEIEAALDDANVNRFAEFLKDYSRSTQFIMITHRKGSMAVADTLYGVTMEEKGVSKMISLKLRGGN